MTAIFFFFLFIIKTNIFIRIYLFFFPSFLLHSIFLQPQTYDLFSAAKPEIIPIVSRALFLRFFKLIIKYLRCNSSLAYALPSARHLYTFVKFSHYIIVVIFETFAFADHAIERSLIQNSFHTLFQSDIVHQSVYELVHSEDREELQRQLLWNSFLPPDLSGMPLSESLAPDKLHFLERSFTVRFRCLLDNTSGFLVNCLTSSLNLLIILILLNSD